MTIRDSANELCIGYGLAQVIFTKNYGMYQVEAKFVPKLVTSKNIPWDLLNHANQDQSFMKIVTARLGAIAWSVIEYDYDYFIFAWVQSQLQLQ